MEIVNNAFISESAFCDNNFISGEACMFRQLLSRHTGLPEYLCFRSNTTNIITDTLSEIVQLFPERKIIISDIEHPTILKQLDIYFPKQVSGKVKLHHHLLDSEIDALEMTLMESIQENSILLVSHVLWNCGIILDIGKIASYAKKLGTIVLVDGAQAVGNIDLKYFDKKDVDFYFGCTHKWLNAAALCGFVAIHPLYKTNVIFMNRLFYKDLFGEAAGSLSDIQFDASSHDIKLLSDIRQSIYFGGIGKQLPLEQIIDLFERNNIKLTVVSRNKITRFVGSYGVVEEIYKAQRLLDINDTFIVRDELLPANNVWLRLGV